MEYVHLFVDWLYESFGAHYPRLSFLAVFVLSGLIGCFVWWMVGYKYKTNRARGATVSSSGATSVGQVESIPSGTSATPAIPAQRHAAKVTQSKPTAASVTHDPSTAGQTEIVVPAARNKINGVVSDLANFIQEGSDIQARFLSSNDAEKELAEGNDWATRVNTYLLQHLDSSYALQFRNASGNAWMGMPANHSIEGGGYWQNIEGKKNCLTDFIKELRTRPS